MSKTVGAIVSAAGMEIGEPVLTAFETDNILQQRLIGEVNNGVRALQSKKRFAWSWQRALLTTTAKVTAGTIDVTNGSTTITSKDSAGANATNFTTMAAGWYVRVANDQQSYKLASVDTVSTPNTAVLETEYVGTTATTTSYTALLDEIALTDTDFDVLRFATFGQAGFYGDPTGYQTDDQLALGDLPNMVQWAHGDFHRDTSGKPRMIARFGVDSTNQKVFKLWPYPDAAYVIELYGSTNYTEQTTFSAVPFGTDAPDLAYDALEFLTCAAACRWDNKMQQQAFWLARYDVAFKDLMAGSRTATMNQMGVAQFRRSVRRGAPGRSQQAFDTGGY